MNRIILLALFATAVLSISFQEKLHQNQPAVTDDLVDSINELPGWKAGHNAKFTNKTLGYAQRLMGSIITDAHHNLPLKESKVIPNLPDTYDASVKYPQCPTIREIHDQSNCGSCWAVATAEAVSDRYCIQAGQRLQISSEDILSCTTGQFGCSGGDPAQSWAEWASIGAVTGGLYGSGVGCLPYPFPQCDHHINGSYPTCPDDGRTYTAPACQTKCNNTAYPTSYSSDKHVGASSYKLGHDQDSIMSEIYQNGPVLATFNVWNDFLPYKSGVYYRKTGTILLGGHAVKIFGWGTEDSEPYWLVANSWNSDWGDKGFFKILRGSNACLIENYLVAGMV